MWQLPCVIVAASIWVQSISDNAVITPISVPPCNLPVSLQPVTAAEMFQHIMPSLYKWYKIVFSKILLSIQMMLSLLMLLSIEKRMSLQIMLPPQISYLYRWCCPSKVVATINHASDWNDVAPTPTLAPTTISTDCDGAVNKAFHIGSAKTAKPDLTLAFTIRNNNKTDGGTPKNPRPPKIHKLQHDYPLRQPITDLPTFEN